jgi:hypothetical protein
VAGEAVEEQGRGKLTTAPKAAVRGFAFSVSVADSILSPQG